MIQPSYGSTQVPLLLVLLVLALAWFITWLVTGVRFASGLVGWPLALAVITIAAGSEAGTALVLKYLSGTSAA
jgi:hypothetical protein